MKEYELAVFCQEQGNVYNWFIHRKLIKGLGGYYIPDPITKNHDCCMVSFRANKLVYRILTICLDKSITEDGKRKYYNYIKYGILG